MKFSVIIPVYNCKPYLEACVRSVLASGLEESEILLVDDGSTDGSGALCDDLAERYSGIRVFHQPNGGVSSARNRGLREASGTWVLFVDGDDTLKPFAPEVRILLEEQQPDVLIFGMRFQYYRRDQWVRDVVFSYPKAEMITPETFGECFSVLFQQNYLSSACNKFIRNTNVRDCGLCFDSRLTNYEDLAFSVRLLSRCERVAVLPDAYYLYRLEEGTDHTVARIARIEDVMGNTDLVAQAFRELEEHLDNEAAGIQIRRAVFQVYLELFRVKMQTTPYGQIQRYCKDFCENSNVLRCLPDIQNTPQSQNPFCRWIFQNKAANIWLYIRYLAIRHRIATVVKRMVPWRKNGTQTENTL